LGFAQGVTDAGGVVKEAVYISDGFSGFEIPDVAYTITNGLLAENDLIFAL
jgi:hypothetical protein